MKIEWKRQHLLVFIAMIMLFAGLFMMGKNVWIQPLEKDISQMKQSVETEQKILNTLRQRQEDGTVVEYVSSRDTQRKLPVLPVVDQFLIGLERAENESNSLILSFAQTNSSEVDIELQGEHSDQVVKVNANQSQAQQTGGENLVNTIGVNKMNFQLTVQSPNFEQLLSFLESLRDLPRIVDLESITFQGSQLEENVLKQNLTYTVTVSTFYDKANAILKDELPQYHYQPPSNKKNPLLTDGLNEDAAIIEEPANENVMEEEQESEEDEETTASEDRDRSVDDSNS